MANLKDIRKRILSVKSTQQITSAMKMVAAAKLKKAQDRIEKARPYADKMMEVLASIALRTSPDAHPLLKKRPAEKVMLVILTSDKGLCGAFNQNIIKSTELFVRENRKRYSDIQFTIIGKKGYDYFKKRDIQIYRDFVGFSGNVDFELAGNISSDIKTRFLSGMVDEIYLMYNRFLSVMSQKIVFDRIIPIVPLKVPDGELALEHIFEPSETEILDDILAKNIVIQVFRALLESEASELGARMTAMDSATSNADEMIEKLTLKYNRARQETITKELIEIVGGAEAL
ncbi:MAG: ATP synthase F1 subunit gamma [Deltaproteobacteria bacterium]|uniref:ATP synthase gamma chain n=1 Tax=Candidatus Zymogenus saltonus TaxID=2844893 RepID=A0A9D8KFD5_9DELT|nr:ATP synthase F1 subunit gamma [Candidatus Zymogenus saltonus]